MTKCLCGLSVSLIFGHYKTYLQSLIIQYSADKIQFVVRHWVAVNSTKVWTTNETLPMRKSEFSLIIYSVWMLLVIQLKTVHLHVIIF